MVVDKLVVFDNTVLLVAATSSKTDVMFVVLEAIEDACPAIALAFAAIDDACPAIAFVLEVVVVSKASTLNTEALSAVCKLVIT